MENNNNNTAEYSTGAIERDKESLNLNAEAVVQKKYPIKGIQTLVRA